MDTAEAATASKEANNSPVKKHHRRTSSSVDKDNSTVIDISSQQPPTNEDTAADPGVQKVEVAIRLDSAYKSYGRGKTKLPVLIGLNMEVPRGQIYGLLGKQSPL
jgi:hypothetical protein